MEHMARNNVKMMTLTKDLESLGDLALLKGDFAEAVNIFRRSLAASPSIAGWIGLGNSFSGLGEPGAARWAYAKGLEIDNGHKEANRLFEVASAAKIPKQKGDRAVHFRVKGDSIQRFNKGWHRFAVKGVNLGVGLPGYFPGEFALKYGTYLRWFRRMGELGVNTVRLYTVNPPGFYEALHEYNSSGGTLHLMQGIWSELPENGDFSHPAFLNRIRAEIREAVNVIHGAANLPERPGSASGRYTADVSSYTVGFLYGREWEPCAVKGYNRLKAGKIGEFQGGYLSVKGGTPFEIWITSTCDYIQQYENDTFGHTHPVSTINWPTLDPLVHPAESAHEDELVWQGIAYSADECNENEDSESLDLAKIRKLRGSGFFVSYHVYPYYPDFMNNEHTEEDNPYLAYLTRLHRHHAGQPVIIAEFGVPSSREITHWQPRGWHHGGHDDNRQGEINALLVRAISDAGMAGSILFSWYDEWFKRNWLFSPFEFPAERNALWFNLQDAEQNYGLLAMYPGYPAKLVHLTGETGDWSSAATLYRKDHLPVSRFPDGHDAARTLRRLMAQHDEGFFYLRLETEGAIDFNAAHFYIGIDTCDPSTGETAFPPNMRLRSPVGMKFLVHLAGREKSRILVCKSYDKYLNNEQRNIRPAASDQAAWVVMMNRTNYRRISKDGKKFYPSRVSSMSNLRYGTLQPGASDFSSLADFYQTGNVIELRLPWSLLQFSDPSSRQVVWHEGGKRSRETDGIRVVVASCLPQKAMPAARSSAVSHNATDMLPPGFDKENVVVYSWDRWEVPTFHETIKSSFEIYRKALAAIPEVGR